MRRKNNTYRVNGLVDTLSFLKIVKVLPIIFSIPNKKSLKDHRNLFVKSSSNWQRRCQLSSAVDNRSNYLELLKF